LKVLLYRRQRTFSISSVFRFIKKLTLTANTEDEVSLQNNSLHFQKNYAVLQELSFLSPVKHTLGFIGETQAYIGAWESKLVFHTNHVSWRTISEEYSWPAMGWT